MPSSFIPGRRLRRAQDGRAQKRQKTPLLQTSNSSFFSEIILQKLLTKFVYCAKITNRVGVGKKLAAHGLFR